MKVRAAVFLQAFPNVLLGAMMVVCCAQSSYAQANGLERSFPQSKVKVEKALQEMQAATAGRLPVLEGFATPGDHPLERYQRGYYQSKFQVVAAPSKERQVQSSRNRGARNISSGASRPVFRRRHLLKISARNCGAALSEGGLASIVLTQEVAQMFEAEGAVAGFDGEQDLRGRELIAEVVGG